jgi:hypothetical protein
VPGDPQPHRAAILAVHHPVLNADDKPMTFEVNIVPASRWTTYESPVATADRPARSPVPALPGSSITTRNDRVSPRADPQLLSLNERPTATMATHAEPVRFLYALKGAALRAAPGNDDAISRPEELLSVGDAAARRVADAPRPNVRASRAAA